MNSIYDILLNFNNKLYDIYEWEIKDEIRHIRKVPIFRVDSITLHDLIDYKVELDILFLQSIYNKTSYYYKNRLKNKNYAFLLTDGNVVIGFESNGKYITGYSHLVYEDEDEVLNMADEMALYELKYHKIKSISHDFKTRNEGNIKKYIYREIYYYLNNDDSVLKYIYLEFFNMNVDNAKEQIIDDLKKYWDMVYIDVYNFLKKLPLRR